MAQAKVSIIIPTYNVEEYLEECLDSVCRQTLKDIEILCVNDGSTDGSLEIIKRYAAKDERIVVLDGPNGGYGKAMNRGLDAATGEYIGIVEPDDFIALTMYEDLAKLADENALDFVKAVGANVRLGVHENVLRGTGFHEGLQHMADMGRLDTGVQLAV